MRKRGIDSKKEKKYIHPSTQRLEHQKHISAGVYRDGYRETK